MKQGADPRAPAAASLERWGRASSTAEACAGQRYEGVATWIIERKGDQIAARAGADQVFIVDGLTAAVTEEVLRWIEGPAPLSAPGLAAAEVLSQLVALGALRPAFGRPDRSPLSVTLRFAGFAPSGFAESVAGILDGEGAMAPVEWTANASDADLIVFLRTSGTLFDVAGMAAEAGATPHLLVDAAYHHTVSLGPLVVPGETACLRCLAGRIGAAWGDPNPPPAPLAARSVSLLAALVALEIGKVAAGDRFLAGRTVALDLATYGSTECALLRQPWCPACSRYPGGDGRIDLPWASLP